MFIECKHTISTNQGVFLSILLQYERKTGEVYTEPCVVCLLNEYVKVMIKKRRLPAKIIDHVTQFVDSFASWRTF